MRISKEAFARVENSFSQNTHSGIPQTGNPPAQHENIPICSGTGYVNGCLTAPVYSIGYFKIPLIPVEDPFRTNNNNTNYEIFIYPNPTVREFHIKLVNSTSIAANEEMHVSIFSLDGRLVYATQTLTNMPIFVSGLAAGCYQVVIKDSSSNIFNKKLVKTE